MNRHMKKLLGQNIVFEYLDNITCTYYNYLKLQSLVTNSYILSWNENQCVLISIIE